MLWTYLKIMKNLHSTEHISHTHSGTGRQLGKDKRFGPPLDMCLQMSGLLKNSHLLSPLSFLLICFHLLCLRSQVISWAANIGYLKHFLISQLPTKQLHLLSACLYQCLQGGWCKPGDGCHPPASLSLFKHCNTLFTSQNQPPNFIYNVLEAH